MDLHQRTIYSARLTAFVLGLAMFAGLCLFSSEARAEPAAGNDEVVVGFKTRIGGRYDNVRMCVASDPGVEGGMAADISLYLEFPYENNLTLAFDLPVFRPILFGAAFGMLQYEPEASLLYRVENDGSVDFIVGPTLGASFHYGPDHNSELSGDARGPDFFAMGPMVGAYLGLDFKRPGESFNFGLGVHPYVTPLFSIDDPDNHQGIVVGALLDGVFRF
jgi:hypothetical protein